MNRDEAIEVLLVEAEIRRAMARYCRGVDRRDEALVASAYHDDAIDEHGWEPPVTGPQTAASVAMDEERFPAFKAIHHFLGSHYIEVEGERARSEVYFIASHRFEGDGSEWDMVLAGRYSDRWERRDGEWKIAHRRCIYDWARTDRVATPWPGPDHGVPKWAHGEHLLGMDIAHTIWGVCGPGDASHDLFPRRARTEPGTPDGLVSGPPLT
jgi:ketosteroid isomerase-like protein